MHSSNRPNENINYLNSIPFELYEKIFSYLDYKSLSKISIANKILFTAYSTSITIAKSKLISQPDGEFIILNEINTIAANYLLKEYSTLDNIDLIKKLLRNGINLTNKLISQVRFFTTV